MLSYDDSQHSPYTVDGLGILCGCSIHCQPPAWYSWSFFLLREILQNRILPEIKITTNYILIAWYNIWHSKAEKNHSCYTWEKKGHLFLLNFRTPRHLGGLIALSSRFGKSFIKLSLKRPWGFPKRSTSVNELSDVSAPGPEKGSDTQNYRKVGDHLWSSSPHNSLPESPRTVSLAHRHHLVGSSEVKWGSLSPLSRRVFPLESCPGVTDSYQLYCLAKYGSPSGLSAVVIWKLEGS